MLGTYHLARAVDGDSISDGDLACALREFSEAIRQFRTGDNPALYAALQNNFGIAMLIDSSFREKPEVSRKHALKRIKLAQRVAIPGSGGANDIRFNAMTLGISQGRKGSGSRK
jgi:hypothetical protein